jgi:putative transcription factor
LFCEICGYEIVGKPARSLVEGATLIVCQKCASLGTQLPGFPNNRIGPPRRVASHTNAPIQRLPKIVEESDVIDEYPNIVKEGRTKLGLSQQDLAFKAKEKITVIQKIEIGKVLPTVRLAKELEHILHVRLLVPADETELPTSKMMRRPSSPTVTLGDIALVKNKQKNS